MNPFRYEDDGTKVASDIVIFESRLSRFINYRKRSASQSSLHSILDSLKFNKDVESNELDVEGGSFGVFELYCFTVNYILGVGILGIPYR